MSYGFIQSVYDERDFLNLGIGNIELPRKYEVPFNYKVIDQGSEGSCVSCSVSELYNFYCKSQNREIDLPYNYLYKNRSNKEVNGMTFKEAFQILYNLGKIGVYTRISSLDSMKKSIIANGPAVIAMIARSTNDEFWNVYFNLGGHAVAVVGFDEESITIKNSWGVNYGNGGFYQMRNEDFNKVLECWTILS